MKQKYVPSKMVNWFEPKMLLLTGVRTVVSGLFGNYADRRETEAALSPVSDEEWKYYDEEYASRDEMWIDFMGDTGDGFNSTFSIASLVASPYLTIAGAGGKDRQIPRGKLLLMGGDQVYPTPAGGLYRQKFRIPFEAAFPADKTVTDIPQLYAIPGNHDWYDGLGGFLKLFCQQRTIGNWQTRQHRSYFARPLPHNYWVWGTDIQLNEDIDKPQLEYFKEVATKNMKPGAKVILITAEPAWIYKQTNKDDKSYERFKFFIDKYITGFSVDGVSRKYEIATILTGDLHHYSHYCNNGGGKNSAHYFGAGGGGAFLHLTHNLPPKLDMVEENLHLKKAFPDKVQSRKLLSGNLAFFIKNWYYSSLIAFIYVLFLWLLKSAELDILKYAWHNPFLNFAEHVMGLLTHAPSLALLSVGIIAGFCAFADTSGYKKGASWYGLLHGILQCFSIYTAIWLLSQWMYPHGIFGVFLFGITLGLAGGIWGGFLMGLYLFSSNLIFNNHLDEASSSLACEDFKCFLRIHIGAKALTVYPIGIKKVTKKWTIIDNPEGHAPEITCTGELPKYHLIEDPVIIPH